MVFVGVGDDAALLLVVPDLREPGGDDGQVLDLFPRAALDRFIDELGGDYDAGHIHRLVHFLDGAVGLQAQDLAPLRIHGKDFPLVSAGQNVLQDLVADFIFVPGSSDDGQGLGFEEGLNI